MNDNNNTSFFNKLNDWDNQIEDEFIEEINVKIDYDLYHLLSPMLHIEDILTLEDNILPYIKEILDDNVLYK